MTAHLCLLMISTWFHCDPKKLDIPPIFQDLVVQLFFSLYAILSLIIKTNNGQH